MQNQIELLKAQSYLEVANDQSLTVQAVSFEGEVSTIEAAASGCLGSAGTLGSLGSASGCFGSFGSLGTYGCADVQLQVSAK